MDRLRSSPHESSSLRHLVEPAAQDLAGSWDGAGLAQHEESRLKRVFGVLVSTEDVPADPEHHRSVPLDQGLEGGFRFSLAGQERINQLLIRSIGFIRLVNSC